MTDRRPPHHGQSRPPAPPVSSSKNPPLPILRRYEGQLPDPSKPPHLLPLLTPHADVANRTSPPQERWSSLDVSPRDFPHRSWKCTTHTFPAAYPRSHRSSTAPHSKTYPARSDHDAVPLTSPEAEKKQKKEHLDQYHAYITRNPPMSYHPPSSAQEAETRAKVLVEDRQTQLWNVINRYGPTDAGGDDQDPDGATIIFGHGTGMHKETWEPAMEALLKHTHHTSIRECWSIDMIMCGQSCLLNQDHLGEVIHMHDHARDLLNFVTNYLPSIDAPAPKASGQLPKAASTPKRKRRLILVAHSVSASMWAIAAHLHPDLFESVALLDATSLKYTPEIALERSGMLNGGGSQIVAITRRDAWMSRQAAEEAMRSNRVYSKWDKRCLDLFLKYAIREGQKSDASASASPSPPAGLLTCPKQLEAAGYRSIWLASYTWSCFKEQISHKGAKRYPRTLSLRIANTFLLNEEQGHEYQSLIQEAGGTAETWGGNQEEHLIVETEPDRVGKFVAQWLDEGSVQAQSASRASARL